MKVHDDLSACAERQAEQPLPSPGSPVHLILRRRHREHCRWLAQLRELN